LLFLLPWNKGICLGVFLLIEECSLRLSQCFRGESSGRLRRHAPNPQYRGGKAFSVVVVIVLL
jgi:hypothetical protein